MKSHVNQIYLLVRAVYLDACKKCAVKASFRDLRTIKSRVEQEGTSFLTITLPKFCSEIERSLEHGFVDHSSFRSFRKSGRIPAFLRGMTGRLFNKETGRINDGFSFTPSSYALTLGSIRQICLALKKVELPCAPERERKALEGFIEIEQSFEMFALSGEDAKMFDLVSSVLWDGVWGDFALDDIKLKHGPGQTAERISGNQKYVQYRWHDRLEPWFPVLGSAYPISCGTTDPDAAEFKDIKVISETEEQPVRVTPVPKTLKGPRIIAIEPVCNQFVQQGIKDYLYGKLERLSKTTGHINFVDQSVNQVLALRATAGGTDFATIDLSEASDRVPRDLALSMFRSNPDLRDAIDACRSRAAEMPDGRVVPLGKFASMGSALCFPVEAMYFYTICVIALLRETHLPVSHRNVYSVSRGIYVYGDDILVPAHASASVLDHLRKYNCKVNADKTFYRGPFRESCGVDAFLGEQVTPVYLRAVPPDNRGQASEILSTVATANQFLKAGYARASEFLFNIVEKLLGKLPAVVDRSPALGRHSNWIPVSTKFRWNRKLHRRELRLWVPSPVFCTDRLEGYGALSKCLSRLDNKTRPKIFDVNAVVDDYLAQIVIDDPQHLERSALYGKVALKRRWVSADNLAGYRTV